MKRDELLEKGYTEEQVTDILNTFHKINSENQKLQSQVENDKTILTKYEELQKQIDESNKAKLSEQEKLELKIKEADKKLASANKIYNTAKAKEILAGLNVDNELLESLVSDDENVTVTRANAFKNQFQAYKEEIEKNTRAQIANLDVKPKPTNITQDDGIMTKDKFFKMTMTEQKLWKDEHIDEYHNLF